MLNSSCYFFVFVIVQPTEGRAKASLVPHPRKHYSRWNLLFSNEKGTSQKY